MPTTVLPTRILHHNRDFGKIRSVSYRPASSKQEIGARDLVVKRLKWGTDLKDLKECKILFVGASERAHIDDLMQIVKTLPILTVG